MPHRLPRPKKRTSSLPEETAAILASLRRISRDSGGILPSGATTLADRINRPVEALQPVLQHLLQTRHILRGTSGRLLVVSEVSAKLHSERVANAKRTTRGAPALWHHRAAIARELPHLLAPRPASAAAKARPDGYNFPKAFQPILSAHEHHHLRRCPPDVERLTDAFWPGELEGLLTVIQEQLSASREVVLLYTRKAVYLAVRRKPKR